MLTDMVGKALRKTLSAKPRQVVTEVAQAAIGKETVAISRAARSALSATRAAVTGPDEAARVAQALTFVSKPGSAQGRAIAEVRGRAPKALAELTQVELNKLDGLARETVVAQRLKQLFPSRQGYDVMSEVYLRDAAGRVVNDAVTGGYRRVDFMVARGEQVLLSLEVTAKAEPGKRGVSKLAQLAKEARIRKAGGRFVQLPDGRLAEIPKGVLTQVARL